MTDPIENPAISQEKSPVTSQSTGMTVAATENFELAPTKEFDKTFGNYLVHGIDEIYLPEPVSWRPETLVWYVLIIIVVVVVSRSLMSMFGRWHRGAYRRKAIARLDKINVDDGDWRDSIKQLPLVLKATALEGFPRKQVAKLSGESWRNLLHQSCPEGLFDEELARCLHEVSYRGDEDWTFGKEQAASLLAASRHWALHHQSEIDGEY